MQIGDIGTYRQNAIIRQAGKGGLDGAMILCRSVHRFVFKDPAKNIPGDFGERLRIGGWHDFRSAPVHSLFGRHALFKFAEQGWIVRTCGVVHKQEIILAVMDGEAVLDIGDSLQKRVQCEIDMFTVLHARPQGVLFIF